MAPVQAEGQDEGALPADALRREEDEGGVRQEGEGGGTAGGQRQKTFFPFAWKRVANVIKYIPP